MPSPTPAVSPRTLRVMMIAAVALLLAGAFAAFAHDGDDDVTTLDRTAPNETSPETVDGDAGDPADSSTSTAVPTTGAPVPESPASVAGDEDPAETTPTTATETTEAAAPAPSGPEDPAADGDGGRDPGPIPPGRYEYATDGTSSINGDEKRLPETTTLTAPDVGADGRQTTTRDMRDGNGDGSVTETTMRYTPEGVYLDGLKSTVFLNSGAFSQSTTLSPTAPFLLIPADAGPGTRTTGTLTGDGITADITFEIVSVGTDTAQSRLVADLSGDVEGRQTSELTTRLDDLLTVKEVSESDVRSGPVRLQSNYTATLR